MIASMLGGARQLSFVLSLSDEISDQTECNKIGNSDRYGRAGATYTPDQL